MTVGQLIHELEQFDENMEVYVTGMMELDTVKEVTWTHTNYPYNKPDKQVVLIE